MNFLKDAIKNIKEVIKNNKSSFIFSLIVIMICNIGTLYGLGEKFEGDRQKFKAKLVQDVNDGKEHDEFQEMVENAAKEQMLKHQDKKYGQIFYDTLPLEHNTGSEEKGLLVKSSDSMLKNSNYHFAQTNDFNFDEFNDMNITLLAKRFNEYFDSTEISMNKGELIDSIINGAIKEMANSGGLIANNTSEVKAKEMTIDNMDSFTIEEKKAYICDKYNLSNFELDVDISVLYHEAGLDYADAFKVATVIYNRTKSKECIRYIHNLTGLDGESLYSQVIATSYHNGERVQQFDGYIPSEAGYDYEKLLVSDPDMIKLNAFLDCLILLKLGEEYENPTFPLAPCFSNIYFYGDGIRNHFNGPISASDVIDNYKFPDYEYTGDFTREDIMNMAKEYVASAKKRVRK